MGMTANLEQLVQVTQHRLQAVHVTLFVSIWLCLS